MSNALLIPASSDHPEVILDRKNSKFSLIGKSLPEDVNEFYDPLLDWLRNYAKQPNGETIFTFDLEYYNSASVRKIVDIMSILETISKQGSAVKIIWRYEESDEMMGESGEDFSDTIEVPFEIVSYELED